MSNEEIVEELLWKAFELGLGTQLAELAGSILLKEKITRIEAYEKAYRELGLEEVGK